MTSVYLGQNRLLVSLLWGGLRLVVPASDMSLTPDLALYGSWELPLTRFLLAHVKPGDFTVDIGAHSGYFSVILASLVGPLGQVYSYEPNPAMVPWLIDNIALNYFADRVHPRQFSVSSTTGTSELHTFERYTGNSTVRTLPQSEHLLDQETVVQVDQVCLDEHFRDIDKIHLLKMDIEGSEYQALLGATRLMEEQRVATLVFEWNPVALQADVEPFAELLREWTERGASLSLLDPSGNPTPVDVGTVTRAEGIIPHVVLRWT